MPSEGVHPITPLRPGDCFWAMAVMAHLRPYAVSPATGCRAPLSDRFGALPTNRKRPPTGRVSSAVDAATAAAFDPRHPIRQEVDQLDQKLDQHREESAKLDILPLGRSIR